LDIFKRRGVSREDILLVFAACIFPVFIWSFYNLLNEIPSFVLRLNLGDLFGTSAYVLAFALLESLLFFLALFIVMSLLAFILPRKLWGDHFMAIGSMLAILISAVAMYFQLNYDRVIKLSLKRTLFELGLVGLTFVIYYVLILSFPRFESAIRSIVRGVSVLSIFYAFLGCLSVLIIIFRNI
jgi:hypothetical protein